MPVAFLVTGVLPLLPLAALPVLFHLFLRRKRAASAFSTFMFFTRIDPHMTRRRRLRELLLLGARTLLLLFLLLALSRPVWRGGAGTGGATVVILLDNSASMAAAESQGSKIAAARAAAQSLLASLGSGDRAALLTLVEDPALPARLLSHDLKALAGDLDRIEPTDAAGRPAQALALAARWIEESAAASAQIHVFSDFQENEWKTAAAIPPVARGNFQVFAHPIHGNVAIPGELAIEDVALPPGGWRAGKPGILMTRISRGEGAKAGTLYAEDSLKRRWSFPVPPGTGPVAVELPLNFPEPGLQQIQLRLEGDNFLPDNRAGVILDCAPRREVWFSGAPADHGLLPLAFSPSGEGRLSGLVPVFAAWGDLSARLRANNPPALFVLSWGESAAMSPADGDVLRHYVETGGHLLLVPGPGDTAATAPPTWVAARSKIAESSPEGLPVLALDEDSPLWSDLRGARGEILLKRLRVQRFLPLEALAGARPLLVLEDGRAIFTETRVGAGLVYGCGFAFLQNSSNLPLKGAFPAFAQALAAAPTTSATRAVLLRAGDRPVFQEMKGRAHLRSLSGRPLSWEGDVAKLPCLPATGCYSVECGSELRHIGILPALNEGFSPEIHEESIPALAGLPYRVVPIPKGGLSAREWSRLKGGTPLAPHLLLLALLAFLAESALTANTAWRRAPAAAWALLRRATTTAPVQS